MRKIGYLTFLILYSFYPETVLSEAHQDDGVSCPKPGQIKEWWRSGIEGAFWLFNPLATIEECKNKTLVDPIAQSFISWMNREEIKTCYEHRYDFFRELVQTKNSLGFHVDEESYYDPANLPFPNLMEVPEEFLNQEFLIQMSHPSTVSKAIKYVEKLNQKRSLEKQMTWLRFKSRFVKSTDVSPTYGRTLFHVPGIDFDRFVLFSDPLLDEPLSTNYPPNAVGVIAVQKRDSSRKELDQVRVYFKDHHRLYEGDKGHQTVNFTTRLKVMGKVDHCMGCHIGGVFPIYPLRHFSDQETPENVFRDRVRRLNQKIISYKIPDWTGFASPEALGPGMGPVKERSEEFIRECSRDTKIEKTSAIFEKLAKHMNCSQCHDDNIRPALRFPLGHDHGIVWKIVVNARAMPKGLVNDELNEEERKALVYCLFEEYWGKTYYNTQIRRQTPDELGLLRSFLLDAPCEKKETIETE